MSGISTVKFSQEEYRVRYDNGSETLANWVQPKNTAAVLPSFNKFRVRFVVKRTATGVSTCPPFAIPQFTLYYSTDGGTNYSAVNTSSGTVRVTTNAYLTDGQATTNQVTASSPFDAGVCDVNAASCATTNVNNATTYMEYEWCLVWSSPTLNTQVLFQMRDNAGAVYANGYTQTAAVTPVGSNRQTMYMFQNGSI